MSFRHTEILLHLRLIAHTQHTGRQSQIHGLIAHIHGGHTNISLCKALRIAVVFLYCRHDLCRLLDQRDKRRDAVAPRAAGCTALNYQCVAHLCLCLRLIDDDEFPRLRIAAARRQTTRFDNLQQLLSRNRLVLISAAALTRL